MLHLLYIFAFTIIAFIAVSNLIRSLITISTESQRMYAATGKGYGNQVNQSQDYGSNESRRVDSLHPELLDESGKPINEPLLVMRSVSVEDARKQLDEIYEASPSNKKEAED